APGARQDRAGEGLWLVGLLTDHEVDRSAGLPVFLDLLGECGLGTSQHAAEPGRYQEGSEASRNSRRARCDTRSNTKRLLLESRRRPLLCGPVTRNHSVLPGEICGTVTKVPSTRPSGRSRFIKAYGRRLWLSNDGGE